MQGWGVGWNMYLNQDVNKGRCYEDQELDTPCREGPHRDSEYPDNAFLKKAFYFRSDIRKRLESFNIYSFIHSTNIY